MVIKPCAGLLVDYLIRSNGNGWAIDIENHIELSFTINQVTLLSYFPTHRGHVIRIAAGKPRDKEPEPLHLLLTKFRFRFLLEISILTLSHVSHRFETPLSLLSYRHASTLWILIRMQTGNSSSPQKD